MKCVHRRRKVVPTSGHHRRTCLLSLDCNPGEVPIQKARKEHVTENDLKRAPADPVLTTRLRCRAKYGVGDDLWLYHGGNGPRLPRHVGAGPVELGRICDNRSAAETLDLAGDLAQGLGIAGDEAKSRPCPGESVGDRTPDARCQSQRPCTGTCRPCLRYSQACALGVRPHAIR